MLRIAVGSVLAGAMVALGGAPAAAQEATRLEGRRGEATLAVLHEPGPGPSVLYVHGATFPSALSVAYRIEGRSWMDDLRARGFDVWTFDFAGFGGSDRPAAMKMRGPTASPVGRAADAASQIERVVLHALRSSGRSRISVLAHSWGTIPAGMFAGRRPDLVERLVLFGPVAPRRGEAGEMPRGGSRLVTVTDQWNSFQTGLPSGQASLVGPTLFDSWARAYLATDAASETRSPPAVLVPTGPQADLVEAGSGRLPYDPALVHAPTLIVRGEWDALARDEDAAWLVRSLSGVPGGARDVKLPRGTHRMHLEENRQALFEAVGEFLSSPMSSGS